MSWRRTKDMVGLAKKLLKIKLDGGDGRAYKRVIFYWLKDMGGVYIKFLQIMAVTSRFMEGWAGPQEMSVFNQVGREPINLADVLPNAAGLKTYETEPFATGSFAQVYKGTLISGEDVAIKVLRPSIANNLSEDLKYLRRLTGLMARFLPKVILDYKEAVREFTATCLLETDYIREAENMKYFAGFYHNHPYVKIPKVYEELSNGRVIVQEYIAGPTLADVMQKSTVTHSATQIIMEQTGSNLWTQLALAGGEALRMAITADYVFGDAHPGNIKLLPDNKIAFIDFGIIADKPTSQRAFYEWTVAYRDVLAGEGDMSKVLTTALNCFCPDIALALENCRVQDGGTILESLALAVDEKMNVMKGRSNLAKGLVANGHFVRLFTEVLDSKNALNLKMDIANFQLMKSMQAFLGSVTTLDNNETGDRFIKTMVAAMDYALKSVEQIGVKDDMVLRSKFSRSEEYEMLLDTMSSLAEGDEFIFEYILGRI